MKNILNISIFILLLSACMVSCDLDRFPKSSIASEQSLETLSHAQKWDTGFKTSFRARLYGSYMQNQDIQADQLNATSDFGNRKGNIHGWTNFQSNAAEIASVWRSYYGTLKNINFFLSNYEKIPVKEAEVDEMKIYVADAHFVRAYYYTELAVRWGIPYKKETASKDLCVPLVLQYDVEFKPKRATNEEVYKQILSDINQALALYSEIKTPALKNKVAGARMSNTFTIDAVNALKTRVLLFMSDWQGAYDTAVALIKTGKYPLVKPESKNFIDMWQNDKSTEEILQMFVSKPDELPNTNGGYFSATIVKRKIPVCTPDWLPSQWVIDMYDAKDLRKAVYFDSTQKSYFAGKFYSGITVIAKFKGNPVLAQYDSDPIWGVKPDSRQAPKAFRVAESYLIAAEAASKLGRDSDAAEYINKIRRSRGLDPFTSTGDKLYKDIQEERTRELAFEGFRLWDLRRWNMPVRRHDPQKIKGKTDFLITDYLDLNIPANHPKMIWGLPINDIQSNPNLSGMQNAGW